MKLLFISLGCDKNLVDSEYMLGYLKNAGIEFTNEETEADIIVVNTCSFINDAKEESINTILEMAEQKKSGKCRLLIVAGCLAQRYKEEVIKEIPEVDAVLGTTAYEEIAGVINSCLEGGSHCIIMKDLKYLPSANRERLVTTGGHYAHLKIMLRYGIIVYRIQ